MVLESWFGSDIVGLAACKTFHMGSVFMMWRPKELGDNGIGKNTLLQVCG
jgi:hypothetical protein